MPGYKLILKNSKVLLKTAANYIINLIGIKDDNTGTGNVTNGFIDWKLQHFTDTAANFTSTNPTLSVGQFGVETDDLLTSPKFKIGDGVTAWTSLPYMQGSGGSVDVNSIGAAINGATQATPNDSDLVMSVESSVAKQNTWTQIKAFLKSYFDLQYANKNIGLSDTLNNDNTMYAGDLITSENGNTDFVVRDSGFFANHLVPSVSLNAIYSNDSLVQIYNNDLPLGRMHSYTAYIDRTETYSDTKNVFNAPLHEFNNSVTKNGVELATINDVPATVKLFNYYNFS